MKRAVRNPVTFLLAIAASGLVLWAPAGDLNPPPGPISPTMKSLDYIDPGTPLGGSLTQPIVIDQSGYYYLRNVLFAPPNYTDYGIVIKASYVMLDLRGFSIMGQCTAKTGIYVQGAPDAPLEGVIITNGMVCGWGTAQMDLGLSRNSGVEECQTCGGGTTDQGCGKGIVGGVGTRLLHVTAYGTAGPAFELGPQSEVTDCAAYSAQGDGFVLGPGSAVKNSVATGNAGAGISVGDDSSVVRCTAISNIDGVRVASRCLVTDNTCNKNSTNGILAIGGANRIEFNHANGNSLGILSDNTLDPNAKETFAANNTLLDNANKPQFKGPHLTADEATAEAKLATTAALGAKTAADGAKTSADGAKVSADGAKIASDQAKVAADAAKLAADGAKAAAEAARDPRTPIFAANLPLTISTPGSYYLAESINVAGNGITIASDNVELDLMGFGLRGGTGSGITVSGARKNITVRNGTVSGWSAGAGIDGTWASNSRFLDLRLSGNRDGLIAGSAPLNPGFAGGNVVTNCTADGNGNHGIRAYFGSAVLGCTARNNGNPQVSTSAGIYARGGCALVNCAASDNTTDGIQADDGCTISACALRTNLGDGIEVRDACRVLGNICDSNGDSQLDASIRASGSHNHIEGNTVTHTDLTFARGIVLVGAKNLMIRNSAAGHLVRYVPGAGNTVGPTVTSANITSSNNPHANYDYEQ